ncbi:sensor domain-containing diguanylate cyclase [Nakamurella deserti]|uniref:GGDEF domain-containing protein n=1 Tax=Nakamurella deserti TaxID=2164074 RepID=UPI001478CB4B|nr:diguanylate cyclase [Nakamurella deserti]
MTGIPLVDRTRLDTATGTEIELFSLGGHDGHLREVNRAFASLLGLDVDQINGRSLLEFVHPEDISEVVAGITALERGQAEVLMETRFLPCGGDAVHLQWVARPVPGTDTWWAAGRDTTEFHRLIAQRRTLRAGLDLALGQTAAAMWELGVPDGMFTWEAQAAGVLGVAPDAVPTTIAALTSAVHPADADSVTAALQQLVGTGAMEVEVRVGSDTDLRHLSLRGKVLTRDRRGRPQRAVGLVLDVTAEKAMQDQMFRMVMSDPLTGVPNRRSFDQSLRSEWRRCTRQQLPLSVLMVDLDHFKTFNDTFGHLVGDAALIAVARALSGSIDRAGDVVARYGGEEFAVVLPGTGAADAATVAARLLDRVRAVVVRQAPGWQATVSVGAATWTPGPETADIGTAAALLTRADAALYRAKAAGRDRLAVDRPAVGSAEQRGTD